MIVFIPYDVISYDQNLMRCYIIVGNIEKRLVFYLGFESHPQHELAKKQMSGFGGMITFFINGNLETAKKFFKNTKVRF
jgi:cystathionine gamma-lyase